MPRDVTNETGGGIGRLRADRNFSYDRIIWRRVIFFKGRDNSWGRARRNEFQSILRGLVVSNLAQNLDAIADGFSGRDRQARQFLFSPRIKFALFDFGGGLIDTPFNFSELVGFGLELAGFGEELDNFRRDDFD